MPTSVNDATIYLYFEGLLLLSVSNVPCALASPSCNAAQYTALFHSPFRSVLLFGTILCVLVVCYRAFTAIFGTLLV